MNNRAQGLSISTIIVALVALVVLLVLIAVFTGFFGNFAPKLISCEATGGTCFITADGDSKEECVLITDPNSGHNGVDKTNCMGLETASKCCPAGYRVK